MGKSKSNDKEKQTIQPLTNLTPFAPNKKPSSQAAIYHPPLPCRHNGRHFSVIPEASPTLLNSLPALRSQLPKHVRYKPIHFVTRAHYIPCWKLIKPSWTLLEKWEECWVEVYAILCLLIVSLAVTAATKTRSVGLAKEGGGCGKMQSIPKNP